MRTRGVLDIFTSVLKRLHIISRVRDLWDFLGKVHSPGDERSAGDLDIVTDQISEVSVSGLVLEMGKRTWTVDEYL
jgi:hypothetical protein